MTDPAKRERAALDVLALLPEWWAVGPTSYDPEPGDGPGRLVDGIPVEASRPSASRGSAMTNSPR